MAKESYARYWQIDILRTVAICMMILYHLMFTMFFFGIPVGNLVSGWWLVWQRVTVILFLLLVGSSFSIYQKNKSFKVLAKKQFRRFVTIGIGAIVVSIFSYIVIPEAPVYFGILHLIAISMLLLLCTRSVITQVLAIILTSVAGDITALFTSTTLLALPLGIRTANFSSIDYTPILPWFSIIALGALLGRAIPYIFTPSSSLPRVIHWLTIPGKYSLFIYMIHEPCIILAVWIYAM